MFGSQALEVAISVVFLYLLLAMMCSVLNEWVAGIFSMRAKNLEKGIRNLLNDPGIAQRLYEHPLLNGLSRPGEKPSYIPARTFALALLDIAAPASAAAAAPQAFIDVRNAVSTIPNPEIRSVLLPLIDEAGNDLKKVRENIETWFNDAMDRVSGWYKRKAQFIVLVWAVAVTIPVNADTIMIANALSRDTTLRASIVSAAQETAKQPLPAGAIAPPIDIKKLQDEFQRLNLPIGWSRQESDPRRVPASINAWVLKFVGLLFTILAVSLGAPFWFDMLNKLVTFRADGKPEKTLKDAAS